VSPVLAPNGPLGGHEAFIAMASARTPESAGLWLCASISKPASSTFVEPLSETPGFPASVEDTFPESKTAITPVSKFVPESDVVFCAVASWLFPGITRSFSEEELEQANSPLMATNKAAFFQVPATR